eukprot:3874068-Pyramimonas_sp.AAC.1
MGHPENRKFLRVLRAGGVKRHVVTWVRDLFRCSECAERSRSGTHRRVVFPRTFRFNHRGSGSLLGGLPGRHSR